MNIQEFITDLREKRQADGSLRLVHLNLGSGGDYFNEQIVIKAIDELEQRMLQTAARMKDIIGPPTALEQIGMQLLIHSL